MSTQAFENYNGWHEEPNLIGVVVVQEWWGINENIKNITARFAAQGFLAVAPDLYHGKICKTADEASHAMQNLDWESAIQMIGAAARFLKQKGAKKVGVVGYCMGGAIALAAAARVPEIDAAAPFYGIPPDALADVTKITKPLQLHWGIHDSGKNFSDMEALGKLETKLKSGHVLYDLFLYDAEHAFMNAARPEVYREESAAIAFKRVVDFFKSLV